jgi:Zn2+/Cd2+-exporting ATPase
MSSEARSSRNRPAQQPSRFRDGSRVKWPKYAPREHRPFAEEDEEWKRLALLAASCLLLGAVAAAADAFNHWTALGFYAAAYVCGGWDAAEDAWARLRQGRLDVHFLMLAVAAGASVIGAWREGALLLFLFSASGHEHYAMSRTRREIGALLRCAGCSRERSSSNSG